MRLDINYREKNCKKYKHREANEYTTKSPSNHWGNQRGNQNIPRNKWQWKHDNPNLWDAAKTVLQEKLIAIQSYLKKQEISQTNNLTLHLKQLEKEEQKNPKVSRRKEIIKIRSDINENELKETIAKINKTKSWFFEKINKTDKPLARLIKKKREGPNQ